MRWMLQLLGKRMSNAELARRLALPQRWQRAEARQEFLRLVGRDMAHRMVAKQTQLKRAFAEAKQRG
jgi:hypothetical protein